MHTNIAQNKLRCLSIITSLCLLIIKVQSNVDASSKESALVLIEVISLYLKTLHNDKWVRSVVLENAKADDEESKGEAAMSVTSHPESIQLPMHSSMTYVEQLWGMYDKLKQAAVEHEDAYKEISPIILLTLVRNLSQLEGGYSKHESKILDLSNRAYSIFQEINDNTATNIDRYAMQVL